MAEQALALSTEERDLLLRILDVSLAETRVEVHRTHFSPDYRKQVLLEEELIRGVLGKFESRPSNRGQADRCPLALDPLEAP